MAYKNSNILNIPIGKNKKVLYIGPFEGDCSDPLTNMAIGERSMSKAVELLAADIKRSKTILGSFNRGDFVAAFIPQADLYYGPITSRGRDLSILLALSNIQLLGGGGSVEIGEDFKAGRLIKQIHYEDKVRDYFNLKDIQYPAVSCINTPFSREIPFVKTEHFSPDMSLTEIITQKYALDVEMKVISPEKAAQKISELEGKILQLA